MSATSLVDKTLKCRDCDNDFIWTASEQEFYKSRGFDNEPVRCPDCRAKKRQRFDRGPKQMFTINCAQCGREDQVPFKPRGDKPVLCKDCFNKQRDGQGGESMAQPTPNSSSAQGSAQDDQGQSTEPEEELPKAA